MPSRHLFLGASLEGPRTSRSAWALLGACGLAILAACAAPSAGPEPESPAPDLAAVRWVDLTHSFDDATLYWPTDLQGFRLETSFAGMTDKGYYYSAYRFATAEHGGTHIDAPVHFADGRRSVDEIPLEQLIGAGIKVDVSNQAASDRSYRVGVGDFLRWEEEHGQIPDGTLVLLATGYSRYWPDRESYMGTPETGPEAVPSLRFPGLSPEAARWLVENRSIKAIGLDTPSIDPGDSELFESHRILFENEIPAFENVAHLDQLPETGFWVVALPMKIRGGSGGPLRIVAMLPP
jgi:kynurenine formamidase